MLRRKYRFDNGILDEFAFIGFSVFFENLVELAVIERVVVGSVNKLGDVAVM